MSADVLEVVLASHEDQQKSAGMCTIVSLVPFPINEEKPGLYPSRFIIPKSDTKIPSCVTIGKATHFVYLDDSRGSLQVRNSSDEVATAIVMDYLTAQLGVTDNAKPALFWLEGRVSPTAVLAQHKEIVENVLEMQRNWFEIICRIADDDWTRYQKNSSVGDFQRVAARVLGWDAAKHPWMGIQPVIAAPETQTCPACYTMVPKGAVICAACSCILDEKRHSAFKFSEGKK